MYIQGESVMFSCCMAKEPSALSHR